MKGNERSNVTDGGTLNFTTISQSFAHILRLFETFLTRLNEHKIPEIKLGSDKNVLSSGKNNM